MKEEPGDHFNKLFWFCTGLVFSGLIFLAALVWMPVPKENVQFAQVILGFITGSMVTGAIGYLLGGSAPVKKPTNTLIDSTGSKVITEDTPVTLTKE